MVYEAFFGLADTPFRLTPDPRYLFLSPKHAEALAHLRAGLIEPGGFVCITGDIGAGKTTLLRAFLEGLGPEVATAYVFNPTLSADDLLQRITRDLGVPAAGKRHVDVMDALNAHLLAQRAIGRLSVVVIDEAQAISIDVLEHLRLLSNLETSTEKLLRLVLVGQPQLAKLLLEPALAQLNQRITLRWHLGPLDYAETVAYVRHRLSVASGPEKTGLFSTPALLLLHRFSKGVPRLVNMIAHRALLVAYVRRRHRVTARSVLRAYGEIRAVPLRTASSARRAGWVAATAAVAFAVVTLGVPRLHRGAAVRDAGAPVALERPRDEPAPAPPADPPALRATTPADAPAIPSGELERRLSDLDARPAFRTAVGAILAAWRVAPLRPDEQLAPDRLGPVAWERSLEDLRLTGNLSMLRLLDLPALLELHVPGTSGSRWVALAGMNDADVLLSVDGDVVRVDVTRLGELWSGEAHVLWRDFETLGRTFGTDTRGSNVARLQTLLARAGAYRGVRTGVFDAATADAVIGFQRSRLLVPDGRVGRLTRIVLYAAAKGYRRPTLAAGGEVVS